MQKIVRVHGSGGSDNGMPELNKLLSNGWNVISSNLVQTHSYINTYDYLIEKKHNSVGQ
jgi:hypothetical protein